MRKVSVNTDRSYNILISKGLLSICGEEIFKVHKPCKAMIITDTNVSPLYAKRVKSSLENAGFEVYISVFEAGEKSKNLNTISQFLSDLADNSFTRKDIVVALGGGVCGDMAGFTAATYMRGIEFIQIPTTLLSQVDSSVGGKTGVDIPQGKNLVGAFWQPSLVLIDSDTLKTLSQKYFCDGMGEVIKYGCIKDIELFKTLEENNAADIIDDIIERCVSIKRDVVERDEREAGERMLLNFGHTLAHSIEKAYNYEGVSHGEAVAVGMVMITRASENNGMTPNGTTKRIEKLCKKYLLKTEDSLSISEMISGSLNDKKAEKDFLNLVILKELGDAVIYKAQKDKLGEFFAV